MYRAKLTAGGVALAMLAGCAAPPEPIIEAAAIAVEPIAAEASPAPAPTSARRAAAGAPRAGVVTAADIDDTLNFGAFARYLSKTQAETRLPRVSLSSPILARLTGPDGAPAPGVRYTLRRPGAAEPFHQGISGVDGDITVLPGALEARVGRQVELRAFPSGAAEAHVTRLATGGARTRVALPFGSDWAPAFLDLVFVVDTTGSMQDELNWLTAELRGLVRRAKRQAPGADIRFGLVVYRDLGDSYVVRNFGFTARQSQMQRWLRAQSAAGGGDYPEAADQALGAAVALDWRRGRGERLLVHIADAPAHPGRALRYLDAAGKAAEAGVQVFALGASGVGTEAEYLMRQAAMMTGGRYLFLTDDSGVGNAHAEPAVSCYRVTALTGLVQRVLASELSGRRVEAAAGDVIREVGSYRRGVCLD